MLVSEEKRSLGGVMLTVLFLCGAGLFPGLFFLLRKVLKSSVTHWSDGDVVSVSESLVSAFHASLATAVGVTVVTSCSDVMTDSHWLVNGFVVFGAPYMAYDIYAMYLTHFYTRTLNRDDDDNGGALRRHSLQTVRTFLLKDWMLVLHHVALLTVFLPVVLFFRRGLGDFFIGCLLITEFSTPFISLGRILIQMGLDNSTLHRVNGVIVLLSFFTCRILVFPFMYWTYGQHFGIPLHRVALTLPLHCNLGNLALLAPQVYWFVLLLKKAKRLYQRQKRGTRGGDKEEEDEGKKTR